MKSINEQLGLPRAKMRTIVIAFDIDGTLRCNCTETCRDVNINVVTLAEMLYRMKNTKLVAWSGGGAKYAQQFIHSDSSGVLYSLFGERCYSKFRADFKPDIAVDDIQDTNLGNINLIVREK